jgi:hypothetical protein
MPNGFRDIEPEGDQKIRRTCMAAHTDDRLEITIIDRNGLRKRPRIDLLGLVLMRFNKERSDQGRTIMILCGVRSRLPAESTA